MSAESALGATFSQMNKGAGHSGDLSPLLACDTYVLSKGG